MKAFRILVVIVGVLMVSVSAGASGGLGIYGIIERVVFEPNEQAPERLQVWGAFAFVDRNTPVGAMASSAVRGYLYFRMATAGDGFLPPSVVKTEWSDLKAVAGTGQAVGFGSWYYIGAFSGLKPDVRSRNVPYVIESSPGRPLTDLRVRPASEAPASPALYQTDMGIAKLSETGSHAAIVKLLREALKR